MPCMWTSKVILSYYLSRRNTMQNWPCFIASCDFSESFIGHDGKVQSVWMLAHRWGFVSNQLATPLSLRLDVLNMVPVVYT